MIAAEKIEEVLGDAVEIKFNVGFMKNSDNCIILIFKNPRPVVAAYDLLVTNDASTLVVYRKENVIDLSIINEKTLDIINIKDLFFQPDSLETFLRYVPNDLPLAFIIADFNRTAYITEPKFFFLNTL